MLRSSTSTVSMTLLKLNSLQIASAPINRKQTTLVAAGLDLALVGQGLQVVAPGQDPIAVISAALRQAPSNELHLVAHGAPGQIELGSGIDRACLLASAAEISNWGVERIYLWSCRVGADLNFISALQELSGARVFASAEALGQGKTLNGSNFAALEEVVKGLAWELAVNPEDITLTLSGSSNQVVNNLVGDISATSLTGTLTVNAGDASDNGIRITAGSANTTITANGSNDTITVNAGAMAAGSILDVNGSATYTVNNKEADTNAAGASNHVTLTYTDVNDNAASITTGSGRMTVTGTNTSDTLTINA